MCILGYLVYFIFHLRQSKSIISCLPSHQHAAVGEKWDTVLAKPNVNTKRLLSLQNEAELNQLVVVSVYVDCFSFTLTECTL